MADWQEMSDFRIIRNKGNMCYGKSEERMADRRAD
jgi:hypothetical protein